MDATFIRSTRWKALNASYVNWESNGDSEKCAANPSNRDVLKRKFLSDVIAKRKANRYGTEYYSIVEEVFRGRFPTVYRFIRKFNHDGWEHENLIRELQRAESEIVIEGVCKDLVERHPRAFFITLHDSIFCVESDLPKVEAGFQREFERIGFSMSLKTAV